MKKLFIIIIPLMPLLISAQQQAGDIFKAASETTFVWVSPLTLPISTATQTALNGKQATITNGSISNAQLANGAVANLSGTNTGDNAVNSLYSGLAASKVNVSDTAAMLTKYVRVNGSGATITGLTASQVGLGNVTNESKATMFTSPTFTGTISGITATMIGLGNVTNESKATMFTNATFTGTFTAPNTTITNGMLAGSIAYSKLSLTGAILNADLAGSIAYSKLSLTGAILNADLAGSIDLATKVTGILPFASNAGTSAATSATTGTVSVSMVTTIITCTPSGNMTLNATGGVTGQRSTFVFTTSGVSSFTITFGTNFKTTSTLATGTTTAKTFCISFLYNGSIWLETSRTAAM